jgi:hypothetical protein
VAFSFSVTTLYVRSQDLCGNGPCLPVSGSANSSASRTPGGQEQKEPFEKDGGPHGDDWKARPCKLAVFDSDGAFASSPVGALRLGWRNAEPRWVSGISIVSVGTRGRHGSDSNPPKNRPATCELREGRPEQAGAAKIKLRTNDTARCEPPLVGPRYPRKQRP